MTKEQAPRLKLRARRVALGLTQAQLGAILHVKNGTVCAWERGKASPGIMKIPELMKALQVDLQELVEIFEG